MLNLGKPIFLQHDNSFVSLITFIWSVYLIFYTQEDKAHKFRGEPKEDPGDGLPTYQTSEIIFKWNKNMKDKKSCDTLHMLYLLQNALELVRLRTIERNKYFKSFGRTDRYINQLDSPQVITNFIQWHNKDRDKNKFDGELLDKSEKLHMINNVISEIGGVKKGVATKIYTELKKDVFIDTFTWLKFAQPKLKLLTHGITRLYPNEPRLEDLSVEGVITVLTFVNNDPRAWDIPNDDSKQDDREIPRGIFQEMKWINNFRFQHKRRSKLPKPTALQMDPMLNGYHAIRKSDYDQLGKDDCDQEYIDSFEKKVKSVQRWERLIVDFVRGVPRRYEYDVSETQKNVLIYWMRIFQVELPKEISLVIFGFGCMYDIPSDDYPEKELWRVAIGTSPKKLIPAGKLKMKSYGPFDGKRIIELADMSMRQLCSDCMDFVMDGEVKNRKGKPYNTMYRGACNQIWRKLSEGQYTARSNVGKVMLAFYEQNNDLILDGFLRQISKSPSFPNEIRHIISEYFDNEFVFNFNNS